MPHTCQPDARHRETHRSYAHSIEVERGKDSQERRQERDQGRRR